MVFGSALTMVPFVLVVVVIHGTCILLFSKLFYSGLRFVFEG